MRFVIVGAGRVGLRTADVLRDSDHEVLLVESDPERAERARSRGYDVLEGDGSREDVLDGADLGAAEAVGALTGDLNANFATCAVAKQYGCRTVMRIDDDYREDIYRQYAEVVDEVIYPERLGAIAAKNALLGGSVRAIIDVAPNLQVLELTITPDSPMRGYSIDELELPGSARLLAFGKHDEPLGIPLADDSFEAGDRVVVLADFDALEDVHRIIVGDVDRAVAGGER